MMLGLTLQDGATGVNQTKRGRQG